MDVNSQGNQNRVSGRDFNENKIQIEKYDGRHTVNIAIPSERRDDRPLVKAQRKELNALVAKVSATCSEEAYEIWQKVHAEIGISCIDEMTGNQYQTAISFLQAMIDRAKDKDASKALVSLLLRNSEDGELRQKLIRFCHVNFGTGRLNDLTRSQLQIALSWLDQHQANDAPHSPQVSMAKLGLKQLLRVYTKEFALTFFVGLVAGAFLLNIFSIHL